VWLLVTDFSAVAQYNPCALHAQVVTSPFGIQEDGALSTKGGDEAGWTIHTVHAAQALGPTDTHPRYERLFANTPRLCPTEEAIGLDPALVGNWGISHEDTGLADGDEDEGEGEGEGEGEDSDDEGKDSEDEDEDSEDEDEDSEDEDEDDEDDYELSEGEDEVVDGASGGGEGSEGEGSEGEGKGKGEGEVAGVQGAAGAADAGLSAGDVRRALKVLGTKVLKGVARGLGGLLPILRDRLGEIEGWHAAHPEVNAWPVGAALQSELEAKAAGQPSTAVIGKYFARVHMAPEGAGCGGEAPRPMEPRQWNGNNEGIQGPQDSVEVSRPLTNAPPSSTLAPILRSRHAPLTAPLRASG
jgi:hypothetical protein